MVLAGAALGFGVVFAIRLWVTQPESAVSFLFCLPVAGLALEFGFRGGLAAAAVAAVLMVVGTELQAVDIGLIGYLSRLATYLLLGGLLGLSSERADAALATAERAARRNALILESSGDAVFGLAADGRCEFINPAGAALVGQAPEEIEGRPMHATIHHSYPDGSPFPVDACPIQATLRDGRTRAVDDEVFWHRAGTAVAVEYVASAMRQHGTVTGVVVTARDISDRKEAEASLMAYASRLAEAEAADRAASAGVRGEVEGLRRLVETEHSHVEALMAALETRDEYTGSHSHDVVELAVRVAEDLGLPEDELRIVRATAVLHDIGKVGVPDAVLRKRGPLTDLEWQVMREHPAIGSRLVASVAALRSLAAPIRAEHERWDGTGYPDGLAGEQIPLAARIGFACDAFHAMTSDRPYRAAMSKESAVAELRAHAGTQFDPTVVDALLKVLARQ